MVAILIDNFPANLVLPTLPSFHKLDPQRLDVRRIQLEGYLKTITSEEFLSDHLHVLGQVILFLSEGEYERQSTELKRMVNTLLNPLKRVATLTRGALKSSGQSSSKMSPVTVKKQPSSETPKPPGEESFGASKPAAKKHFELLYQDKTGNSWGTSKESFVKRPSKFYPLEIDYGGDEDTGQQLGIAPGSKSTLAPEIQDLIRMIFDVESMKKAMLEFEIDIKKMPLGKLSRRQIESAYSVLSELQREIVGTQNPSKILDCTNRFYTLVPHDFGMTKPPPLNSEEVIKIKTQMLDNLLEIEVAYSLLKQEDGVSGGKDPLDLHYEQLKMSLLFPANKPVDFFLQVLPKGSDEFSMLQEYVSNTHAVTHSQYSLEVLEVFKVDREGEGKKYKPFSKLHNRQLLWHGSRKTNFVGILSQGLRIAPPEAPVTGYMFGKGVYFADMVSKSADYCSTSRSDNEGLMLLCEVALGDM
ncbi:poly [ADP-ribose] polymerase 1-like isoform X5 [Halichondria panicea]